MIKFLSVLLSILILIPLSPSGKSALSQITGVTIASGVMNLDPNSYEAVIYAFGFKKGRNVNVWCHWKNGWPKLICIDEIPEEKIFI